MSEDLDKGKSIVENIFEGKMFIRSVTTPLVQIFCIIILNFQVFVKRIIDADDNSRIGKMMGKS